MVAVVVAVGLYLVNFCFFEFVETFHDEEIEHQTSTGLVAVAPHTTTFRESSIFELVVRMIIFKETGFEQNSLSHGVGTIFRADASRRVSSGTL